MTLSITSAFDGGNIRVLNLSGHRADLEIVKDQNSDFHQWFYFRLAGAAGEEVELRILNCGGAAYPDGWPSYKARISERSEEHTYELQSLMRISYARLCFNTKKTH